MLSCGFQDSKISLCNREVPMRPRTAGQSDLAGSSIARCRLARDHALASSLEPCIGRPSRGRGSRRVRKHQASSTRVADANWLTATGGFRSIDGRAVVRMPNGVASPRASFLPRRMCGNQTGIFSTACADMGSRLTATTIPIPGLRITLPAWGRVGNQVVPKLPSWNSRGSLPGRA